jgi:hypothetical protein
MDQFKYIFYYLPQAIRKGYTNSQGKQMIGKVGLTRKTSTVWRLLKNESIGNKIRDYRILEEGVMTYREALAKEKELQTIYDCLDNMNNPDNKRKMSERLKKVDRKLCKYCSIDFPITHINQHEKSCTLNQYSVKYSPPRVECKYCSLYFANTHISRHEKVCGIRSSI